jgi:hypothetical protein
VCALAELKDNRLVPRRPAAVVSPTDWLFGWATVAARVRQRLGGADRAADIERLWAVARRRRLVTAEERGQALVAALTVHGWVALAGAVAAVVLLAVSSFVLTVVLVGLGALFAGLMVTFGVLCVAAYYIRPAWLDRAPWRRNTVVVLATLAVLTLAALVFLSRPRAHFCRTAHTTRVFEGRPCRRR